jgi:hypothetical protein
MHDRLVADVAVREHDLVDPLVGDEPLELRLGMDRDAGRVARPGQLRRVAAVGDAGDLGGGERDDLGRGIVAVDDVEVVEVLPANAGPTRRIPAACPTGTTLGGQPRPGAVPFAPPPGALQPDAAAGLSGAGRKAR